MTAINIIKHGRLLVIHLHGVHLLLRRNPYGGCAAGRLAIYIKKTGGCSVKTEWQTV